jgi:hypothetical protein
MKTIISLTLIAFAAITLTAQSKPTTEADYNGTFGYAVGETNKAFPFIFTVVTETFEGGKLVSTETDINERQAPGVERKTQTLTRGRETLRSYSVMTGFGDNTYCSTDAVSWTGPQKFVCRGPNGSGSIGLYGPRTPESVEYSVTERSVGGKPVKVYRKYAIFAAKNPNGKRSFEEKIATIDSRGFLISVVGTEGILDPKTITLVRKQTWDLTTKFKPVVAPK